MNLTVKIESAELRFKQILEEFFISIYDEKSLPSHGIEHHRRVWIYSKELLSLLISANPDSFPQIPEKLIIASYLHDIGMSVETGIWHGIHSKDLCIKFLNLNNLPLNDYQDVLFAIENHDRKEYKGDTQVSDLLTLLSVADDLDAFGFIGIYRYSEIYLTRGTEHAVLGNLINYNAAKRFENFEKIFRSSDDLVRKHKKRYDILCNFFNGYNEQIKDYQFEGQQPTGYCGVIELIEDVISNNKILEDICRNPVKFSNDTVIDWFFKELADESADCPEIIQR